MTTDLTHAHQHLDGAPHAHAPRQPRGLAPLLADLAQLSPTGNVAVELSFSDEQQATFDELREEFPAHTILLRPDLAMAADLRFEVEGVPVRVSFDAKRITVGSLAELASGAGR